MSEQISQFKLVGLHCESCKKITEKRVGKLEGVSQVTTDLETGVITIQADREVTKTEVVQALSDTNYQVK